MRRDAVIVGGNADRLASAEELRRTTAPALLLARARKEPGRVAFRAKKRGLYLERTWAQYAEIGRASCRERV